MRLEEKEVQAIGAECDRFADRLVELGCDSVALFITMPIKDGCTEANATRRGNYYAQIGCVQEWLESVRDTNLATKMKSGEE